MNWPRLNKIPILDSYNGTLLQPLHWQCDNEKKQERHKKDAEPNHARWPPLIHDSQSKLVQKMRNDYWMLLQNASMPFAKWLLCSLQCFWAFMMLACVKSSSESLQRSLQSRAMYDRAWWPRPKYFGTIQHCFLLSSSFFYLVRQCSLARLLTTISRSRASKTSRVVSSCLCLGLAKWPRPKPLGLVKLLRPKN